MDLKNFRFEVDADGVALVSWDMPGRSMNVINAEVIAEIGGFVDRVASDAGIKGAVITSGKAGFSGGADLTMLQKHYWKWRPGSVPKPLLDPFNDVLSI